MNEKGAKQLAHELTMMSLPAIIKDNQIKSDDYQAIFDTYKNAVEKLESVINSSSDDFIVQY